MTTKPWSFAKARAKAWLCAGILFFPRLRSEVMAPSRSCYGRAASSYSLSVLLLMPREHCIGLILMFCPYVQPHYCRVKYLVQYLLQNSAPEIIVATNETHTKEFHPYVEVGKLHRKVGYPKRFNGYLLAFWISGRCPCLITLFKEV